ncbi:unnamed protein product [Hymenolepis diminuta]|uniref:Uncharacterized protein n=1 Tax=Hymenolepis diminuta TaxID=6216 RepID=A0A564YG04_HYMDI|nr:unnamed protein product [Hymenolepis diminuta]
MSLSEKGMQSNLDPSSMRLLNDIRQDAEKIKKIFLSTPSKASIESAPISDTASPLLKKAASLKDSESGETPHFAHYQALDLWRAESLVNYSAIKSTLCILKSDNLTSEDLVFTCQTLTMALRKLLGALNIESITYIVNEYVKICEENALIRSQDKIDLNRTDVFAALESICDKKEYEDDTLKTDLRNAKYDLDRARESLEVSQKTVAYVKAQLQEEKKRYTFLETASSEIASLIRNLASDLNCLDTASNGLQIAHSLSRRIEGLLTSLPWLRSWRESDSVSELFNPEVNPYHLLQLKEKELKSKIQSLESTSTFIDQLASELKENKSEKSRLSEELESKNRLIQKLQDEIAEKAVQVERYRATFDELFDPVTAANFAKQVAERYSRYNSSIKSKNSGDTVNQTGSSSQASHRNTSSKAEQPVSISSRHVPEITPIRRPAEFTPIRRHKLSPVEMIPGPDKENKSDDKSKAQELKIGQEAPRTMSRDASLKKSSNSPTLGDAKRLRLANTTPKAPLTQINVRSTLRPNPLESKRPQLPRQQETKPPSSQHFLSSNEKHDPGCATS